MKHFFRSLSFQLGLIFCAVILLSGHQSVAYTIAPPQVSEIKGDGVIKILAIGNSFSEDALEYFLYDLAKAGGHKIIIGNLYIGGAELALHWKNASGNKDAYSYRKIGKDGEKVVRSKMSIASALADERWDYISFQQVSSKSGLYQTYTEPLPALVNYVKEKVQNPDTRYILHQTWAYAQTSTHKGFANYGNSQKKMYSAIVKTTNKINKAYHFDMLIPSGTAIQNARTSFVGDHMNRDGYHLNLILGRYTASCTWYEKIFNESVIGNTFHPEKLSNYETEMAQNAAHTAVLNPFKVTVLKQFKSNR
ncbi:MAG TPA: DUF4886 domain-containing protein [Pelobium sp.]|nr:DUF4886 domain-containing protein [Pelobium sp.]